MALYKYLARQIVVLMAIAVIAFNPSWLHDASSQETNLVGPIILSNWGGVVFQDVGAGRVWKSDLPFGFPIWFGPSISSPPPSPWSPNGCKLLGQTTGPKWVTISISDMSLAQLPEFDHVNINWPFWSPDSRSLTFTSWDDNAKRTAIYLMMLDDGSIQHVLSFDGPGAAIQWISETTLLYSKDGEWRVWDSVTGENFRFGTEHFPLDGHPQGIYFYGSHSPNGKLLADYDDIEEWIEAQHEIQSSGTTTLNDSLPASGFDIYFLNEGTSKHIDVGGQVIQTLEWSPSSERVSLTTYSSFGDDDAGGIYIYDISEELLQKVGDSPSLYRPEFGPVSATWSPDEEWLAFRTPTGPVIYSLTGEEEIELDSQLEALRLEWSPVMDYSDKHCDSR